MNIRDKVVLITGASEGIGAACVRSFRDRGAKVVLTARSLPKLEAEAREGEVVVAADLMEVSGRRRIVDAALERHGRIDILINNAGVGLYASSWCASDDEARQLFELNFFAPLDLIRRVVPVMRKHRSGCIVNVSSIAGKMTLPWLSLYSASKYAICSLTDGLRMELRSSGIRAIAVCPGYVRTDFQRHVIGAARAPGAVAQSRFLLISARQCAEAIARGVESDARTVVTPWTGWLAVAFARLFPRVFDSQLVRYQTGRGQS